MGEAGILAVFTHARLGLGVLALGLGVIDVGIRGSGLQGVMAPFPSNAQPCNGKGCHK